MPHKQPLEPAENRRRPPKLIDNWATEESGFQVVGEQKRAARGTVVVAADKGWLRLRWSYAGRRYFLSIGLQESKLNRSIAEAKAKVIERDLALGQFDPTLAKYKQADEQQELLSAVELFERFTCHKQRQVDPRTLEKYVGLTGHLASFFRQRKAAHIGEDDAFKFRDWLLKRLSPVTVSERLGLLRSCWRWAEGRKLLKGNPWSEVKVKVPPKQQPRPFTQGEASRIVAEFRADPVYHYYADFAEFLLSTGCRMGEAIGLRWKHVAEDCSEVWIGEAWSRGARKSTKTNRARGFEVNERIRVMLQERRPESVEPEDLVFPSPQNKPIDDHNFRNRAWKPILNRLGIEYRMPRSSRHSFVSRAIDQGLAPVEVAEITGHSTQTIYRNYLGNVRGKAKLPDLLPPPSPSAEE